MKSSYPYLILAILVLSFFWSCSNNEVKETTNNAKVSVDKKAQVYIELIEAVNSKDTIVLKDAILKHWSDTLIGQDNRWLTTDMNYWIAFNMEFGPLKFISYGDDEYNENKVAWFKGIISNDWIGLEFDFTKDNRIDRTNVLRSCSPSHLEAVKPAKTITIYAQAFEAYFKKMEAANLFSGVVLIAKGDEILHKKGYGFSDREMHEGFSSSQKMVIASTTKMFTTVAIAQLIEQGKLDLNTPISTYLDDFPDHIGDQVTLAHLLTHTSGIELDDIDGFMPAIRQARSIDEFYKLNLEYLPKMEFYEDFKTLKALNYSNENFDILGKLIEVRSGQNFYDYLFENILKPLNMNNTGPIDMKNDSLDIAMNYQINREGTGNFDNGFRDKVHHSDLSYSRPAGSYYSTVDDLYAFMLAFNNNQLVNDKLRTEFTTKQVENLNIPIYKSWYGYGIYVNEREGLINYGHAGGLPGTSSRCEYYPELDIYVIVTSNYNGAANLAANYIGSEIAKRNN